MAPIRHFQTSLPSALTTSLLLALGASGCTFGTESSPEATAETATAKNALESSPGTVLVAVDPAVHGGLSQELTQLSQDLSDEGWTPIVQQASVADAVQLRNYLRNAHAVVDLAAVLLVGDFPQPQCEFAFSAIYGGSATCDTFLSDLDGAWNDVDGDGDYDLHSDGQGDMGPEIAVGRLHPTGVSLYGTSDVEMLKVYLQRNHAYRTGALTTVQESLYSTIHAHHYNPDLDDSQQSLDALAELYSETRVLIYDDEEPLPFPAEFWVYSQPDDKQAVLARDKMQEQMGVGLEYVTLAGHGNSNGWSGVLYSSDVSTIVQGGGQLPVFVESHSCKTGQLDRPNSFGSTLTMGGAQAFFGPTRESTSYLDWDVALREAIGTGTFGDGVRAFHQLSVDWQSGSADLRSTITSDSYVLLGDPTLRLRTPAPSAVQATITLTSNWQSGYCADVAVSNQGSDPISSWTVDIDLNQSSLSQLWSAEYTVAGAELTASSLPWNGYVAPGSSTNFGFCATKTGPDYTPEVVGVVGE